MSGGAPPTVLIDARNVLRSKWPNIPEEDVVDLCCAWAEAHGVRAIVVFDGRAPRTGVGEYDLIPACTVVGTGNESADAWLARAADDHRASATRFWLVTSDRALRADAGAGAEKVIGGGSFARDLTSDRGAT